MLLALFAFQGMHDLDQMNGLKNSVSLLTSAISIVTSSLAGLVAWPQALVMMAAATIGSYAGAPMAGNFPVALVRSIIIVVRANMTLIFFARIFH